jgi:hypothetical protein
MGRQDAYPTNINLGRGAFSVRPYIFFHKQIVTTGVL